MKTKYECTEPDCIGQCEPFVCLDCGANTTHINEYYMLEDDVWFDALKARDRNGMLCIACVENRLGRQLQTEDFARVPLNFAFQGPFQSQRLASRINSRLVRS